MGANRTDRQLAILSFHKIGEPSVPEWDTWFYIPEATFVRQLQCLHENGWRVIDLAAFLRGLTEPEPLPARAALITFDDGYRSLLEVAVPCLRRFDFPAVVFVPTAFIGGTNTFDADVEPEEAICDWDALRALERHRVAVQSHGVSHRAFSDLEPAEQEEELIRSRTLIESALHRPVEVFAFPYGDAGQDREATGAMLRRAGYRAACLYGGGPIHPPFEDLYTLPRIAMGPDTDLIAELEQAATKLDTNVTSCHPERSEGSAFPSLQAGPSLRSG